MKEKIDFIETEISKTLSFHYKKQYLFRRLTFFYSICNTLLVGSIIIIASINISQFNEILNYLILVNTVMVVMIFTCNILFTPKELWIKHAYTFNKIKDLLDELSLRKIEYNDLNNDDIEYFHNSLNAIKKEHFDEWFKLRNSGDITGKAIQKTMEIS